MSPGEVVTVSGDWLRTWWSWPRQFVDRAVRDEAAAWFLRSVACACTRPALEALPADQLRDLAGVFAGWMRDGMTRSFLQADGSRCFLAARYCGRDGPCPERRVVRVVLVWK